MVCTSSLTAMLSCAMAAFIAVALVGVLLASYRVLTTTRNQKSTTDAMHQMSVRFLTFLAIALINFATACAVLLLGPLALITKMVLEKVPRKFMSILITGGNSGIGEQLALKYAEEPGVRLILVARDEARLKTVAAKCREKGADVIIKVADVRDAELMDRIISEADEARPLDLVIANAGVANTDKTFTPKLVSYMIDVNVKGVFNTCLPALARMKARGQGQIAVMSSVAGIMPVPTIAEYTATKFAVEGFGEAIRPHMASHGVGVTTICPGFVRSRMTEGMVRDIEQLHEDVLMPTTEAASIIVEGIAHDATNIVFPVGVLPYEMRDVLMKSLLWTSKMAVKTNIPYIPELLMPIVGLDRTPIVADAA